MLRSAVLRYDVKHACINDCHFDVWNSQKLNNWPTVMIVAPDQSIIFKTTEEGNEEILQHKLLAAMYDHLDRQQAIRERQKRGENCANIRDLNSNPLPLLLEKNKPKIKKDLAEEQLIAIRQNLSQPGKVIVHDGRLIIVDSAHNRILLLDEQTHAFIEQIGSGRQGHREGQFLEAQFNLPQGVCAYKNTQGQSCLLVCDVKNHLIRSANLHTK